jgi:ATP-dependent RNA circularization protein (DNA/RNA ligase family)
MAIPMTNFFRFPQTPHLAWLGRGAPRDEKILSVEQIEILLNSNIVVEEKLDGANLGFSLNFDNDLLVQNRGQYVRAPYSGQFVRLHDWLNLHGENIRHSLIKRNADDLILFGEWCAARHSLNYDRLPDLFLLFDVYERSTRRFWSSRRRNLIAQEIGLATVPKVFQGHCDLKKLKEMLTNKASQFRHGPLEGFMIRRESEDFCEDRAKLVRANFTQTIEEHWSRRRIEWNRVLWAEK